MKHFVVIRQQVEGNTDSGFTVAYYSDLNFFPSRTSALKHGYRSLGHDDFNIGTVDKGHLIAFGWGETDFGPADDGEPYGGYDLDQIERETFILGHRWLP